jgi:hypothetical protein
MLYFQYMKKFSLVLLMWVSFISLALAEPQTKVITLKDGSTVQGKIVGLDQGAYVVVTPTLGELRLNEGDVVSVVSPGDIQAPQVSRGSMPPLPSQAASAASSESTPSAPANLQQAQTQIMGNPAMMADIQSLASDPEILAIVSDPAFMQAAQAKDMAAIQANPRTAQLMNNPKFKALMEKLQASQASR